MTIWLARKTVSSLVGYRYLLSILLESDSDDGDLITDRQLFKTEIILSLTENTDQSINNFHQ